MEEKSITKMTTRELRAYIRELTPQVNERFKEYEEALTAGTMTEKPTLEFMRERLIGLGTGKSVKGGIGLGLSRKLKSELIEQARALEQTLKADIYTGTFETLNEEKTKQAYESFKKTTKTSLDYQEYKNLSEVLGAAGSHVVEEFGVYNIIKAYEHTDRSKRPGFLQEMNKTLKESQGQGWTKEDLIDRLKERIE